MRTGSPSTDAQLLVRHADLTVTSTIHKGLKGVLVDTTAVSEIDDVNSRLRYRGYELPELAERCVFEEVVHLLLWGELPTAGELEEVRALFEASRRLPPAAARLIELLPRDTPPMAMLRTVVSALGCLEPAGGLDAPTVRRAAVKLTAQVPAILAAWRARVRGEPAGEPPPGAGHAGALLHALTGRPGDAPAAAILDRVLTIHADHEFNASCFSARVTISTLSDLHAAITSAIGTLSGSLHGGANERVLELVEALGAPEAVEPYVLDVLGRKGKIPGFGQRGCRYEDPRAVILKEMAEALAARRAGASTLPVFRRLHEVMRERTTLWPNVDFYSASVLDSLGVPRDMFTPVFVASRIVGWCAHVLEQLAGNVIIRPKGVYDGPGPRPVPPLDQRRSPPASGSPTNAQ
jgi:citrate synthase